MTRAVAVAFVLLAVLLPQCRAQQCGKQANFALCGGGLCCSQHGWCGTGTDYCGDGCQSGPCGGAPTPGGELASIISNEFFNRHFPDRNKFYTYQSFINAAKGYPSAGFGITGSTETRKREVAAFLAHIEQETTGLRYIEERNPPSDYCQRENTPYTCAPGKKYFGRGPLQLSWNYNYGLCGSAIGENLLANPDRVAKDATVAFKTAIWFWSEPQWNKPSCRAVMTGDWTPSGADNNANRRPGFGVTINIINGKEECNKLSDQASNRIKNYRKFCSALGVDPGQNLDCQSQRPFNKE